MNKKFVLVLLVLLSIVNIALSVVVQIQKHARETGNLDLLEKCFDVGGGCATVQSSSYANTFGISNPIYGIVFFTVLAILFGLLAWKPKQRYKHKIFEAAFVILLLGSCFSLWLLYVQFFMLKTTCIYCLWVDGLMLASSMLYIRTFWKEIHYSDE